MKVPCAITIAGSDSGGGAGIAADLKTFSALGVHGLCVITAVTAQNTQRVEGIHELPPEFVRKQIDAVMRDFDVEVAKTGMLSNAGIIREVKEAVGRYGLRLIVDPVMFATTGGRLLKEEALDQLRELIGNAELVTPNVPEAQRLTGRKIETAEDAKVAAREISKLGPRAVLIKGGHLPRRDILDLLFVDGKFHEFRRPRIKGKPVHGVGCSFSAAITAELAKGASLPEAVHRAGKFIAEAVRRRLRVGKGLSPVNPVALLMSDAEEGRATREVWSGAQLLASEPKFANLLPEVGSNLAMALPWAKERSDIIGLSGRIIKVGGLPHLTGFPVRGGSEHVANVILTAMRYDPSIRAGLNIRFSDEILQRCQKLGLRISEFSREVEPKGVKTMHWGTERAIESAGAVPDVIFDRGGKGKEPMIRLLGQTARGVAKLALKIARLR